MTMKGVNTILSFLNQILVFVQQNLFWTLVAVYALNYVYNKTEYGHSISRNLSILKERCMGLFKASPNGQVMNYGDMTSSSHNQRHSASSNRTADMKRIREKQQERATKASLEAEKERKIKQAEERKRRNEIAQEEWKRGGRVLGEDQNERPKRPKSKSSSTSSSSGSGYNPMQPWTSNTGGYRPARRTVSRG